MSRYILSLLALFISGCVVEQPFVRTQRKVMHKWSADYDKLSFYVGAIDNEKSDNLEFEAHADRLSSYFVSRGNTRAESHEKAELLILLDYVTGGYKSHSNLAYSKNFKDVTPQSSRVENASADPSLGGVDYQNQYLQLNIYKVDANGSRKIVYQGTIGTIDTITNSLDVIPIMIDGAMWDFPGRNGSIVNLSHHSNFSELVTKYGVERARKNRPDRNE